MKKCHLLKKRGISTGLGERGKKYAIYGENYIPFSPGFWGVQGFKKPPKISLLRLCFLGGSFLNFEKNFPSHIFLPFLFIFFLVGSCEFPVKKQKI